MLPLPSIRVLARRDGALAGGLGAIVLLASLWQGYGVLAAAGSAALCLPLAWRTRWPLGVLAVVACGAMLYLAVAEPFPSYVPPLAIAVYTVAVRGDRRRTLSVGAALLPFSGLIALLFSPEEGSALRQTFELSFQLGFALAIGEAVRSQRAFIGATRERAVRAAHEHELEARRRVDEERVRIARDVHDVVAHSLATIATQASVGVHLGERDPERAVEVLRDVKEVSTEALHDLRYALRELRETGADASTGPTPSLRELPELVERARSSGLRVVLRMEGSPAALPTALQVAIYRIVQEGLTNVMRHAGGATTTVRIAVTSGQVEVGVTDDGSGEPSAARVPGSGSGLIGMRERASALGGAFEAGRAQDGGFRVRVVLPLDRQHA